MSRYIELDAAQFFAFLEAHGFSRLEERGREVQYIRRHHTNGSIVVKVYTSIMSGATTARKCGGDAIRVVAVAGDRGIYKATRTFRTGSQEAVQERTLERMREAYAACNRWIREHGRGA